jgi:predicted ester cyclase
MTTAEHAAREIGNALTARDWVGLRGLLSDDFVDHSAPPGTPSGPDGYVEVLRWVSDELGITYSVEDVVASDTAVALRATARGVHTSDAFGFPATGRPFAMSTMHWYAADGERLTSHWGVLDQLGMLAQVGALPASH